MEPHDKIIGRELIWLRRQAHGLHDKLWGCQIVDLLALAESRALRYVVFIGRIEVRINIRSEIYCNPAESRNEMHGCVSKKNRLYKASPDRQHKNDLPGEIGYGRLMSKRTKA